MSATPFWLRVAPLCFVCLWSGGFTAVKLGLHYAEPLTLQVLRYVIVVGALVPVAALLRLRLPPPATLRHLALMGATIQFGYFAATNLAQAYGMSAAGLALVIALQPILVGLLAPYLAGEAVDRRRWLGLVLGLLGAGVVITTRGEVSAQGWLGLVFALLALLTMTAGALLEKRGGKPCHPVLSNLLLYLVGLLLTLPVAALTESMQVHWSWGLAGPMAYMVLANSLIATSLLLAMIRHGEAARASALFFLVPPLAALWALLFLGEPMSAIAWGGTAIAALGVALAQRAK